MLTFGSNLSHPNWVIPPDECIWLNPFLGDVLLLCLHCPGMKGMDDTRLFPPRSIFTGSGPQTSCVSEAEKKRGSREGGRLSVFAHIFPLWHVAGLVHRVPPGMASHTHTSVHMQLWERCEKATRKILRWQTQRVRLHTYKQMHFKNLLSELQPNILDYRVLSAVSTVDR